MKLTLSEKEKEKSQDDAYFMIKQGQLTRRIQ